MRLYTRAAGQAAQQSSACWLLLGMGLGLYSGRGTIFSLVYRYCHLTLLDSPGAVLTQTRGLFLIHPKVLPGLTVFLGFGIPDTVHLEKDSTRWWGQARGFPWPLWAYMEWLFLKSEDVDESEECELLPVK